MRDEPESFTDSDCDVSKLARRPMRSVRDGKKFVMRATTAFRSFVDRVHFHEIRRHLNRRLRGKARAP